MREVIEVNVLGVLWSMQHAIKRMSKKHGGPGGSIVLLSSIAADIGGPNEYVWYAASKGAVESITYGLSKELAGDGIRVNCVSPGASDTRIHADAGTPDPVAYWQGVKQEQQRIVDWIQGSKQVTLQGPNVDLKLSVAGRTFINCFGDKNLPDGEIFTGPVEDSANGWVRYTYPAVYQGRVVEGIELSFEQGRVVKASAKKNDDLLQRMLERDAGARYIGEFAIGTNFEINRFTHNILLDEKIGGSFHMALGAGYPESGSKNTSAIHWDMICDLRQDSEIRADGELMYKDGKFVI